MKKTNVMTCIILLSKIQLFFKFEEPGALLIHENEITCKLNKLQFESRKTFDLSSKGNSTKTFNFIILWLYKKYFVMNVF